MILRRRFPLPPCSASCCSGRSARPYTSCRRTRPATMNSRCSSSGRSTRSMPADIARFLPHALVIVASLAAATADAALPRAVGRAFLDAGIPLNHVAIVVQDTTKLRPLFAYDANRPRSAASVMKLVTTFAALELLGPEYRWKTEAYVGGPRIDGALHGDLLLKGYGDPKITVEQWQSFIAQLRAKGLSAVEGDLVLDRSRVALPPHDPAAFDHEPD